MHASHVCLDKRTRFEQGAVIVRFRREVNDVIWALRSYESIDNNRILNASSVEPHTAGVKKIFDRRKISCVRQRIENRDLAIWIFLQNKANVIGADKSGP